MPASPPPAQFNFARHLLELNAGRAAKVAYRDDERTLTYGELSDASADSPPRSVRSASGAKSACCC